VLAMVGVIAAALVVATAVSTWQAVEANAARRLADKRLDNEKKAQNAAATDAAIARAVNDFLQEDLLGQVGSVPLINEESERSRSLTVKEALDRAAERIGTRFQDQPLVEAAIRTTIGVAYHNLYEFEPAALHLERALALRSLHLGSENPETLESVSRIAWTYQWLGRHQQGIDLRRQLADYYMSHLGPEHRTTLAATLTLAEAYEFAGDLDTSERLLEPLLDNVRSVRGPTHPDTLSITLSLAKDRRYAGRFLESIALYEEWREAFKSTFGADVSAQNLRGFAEACVRAGKYDQADRLLRDALQADQKLKDSLDQRIGVANTHGWMAESLVLQKRFGEAEPLARQALRSPFPWGSQHHHNWEGVLGAALLGQRNYAEAEVFLLRSYAGLKQAVSIVPMQRMRLAKVGEWIVGLYEATNQPEKAHSWQERILQDQSKK
jgi:tetratricopeptide (TPR) repeat protein